MLKLIHDEKELRWFYDNIVVELKSSEAHFVSLSARNKYLTAEERIEFGLGRTEMFEKRLVRTNDWGKFLRTIKKFETVDGAYTTKIGKTIPGKTIVCYFNINPSDSLKAYRDFSKVMNEYLFELSQCAINNRDMSNVMYRINKQPSLLMNSYQKATGTRVWIDFDFDVPKDFLPSIEKIVKEVKFLEGRAYIIDTKSGYHLLISKDTEFSKFFNPKTIVDGAIQDMKYYFSKYTPNVEEKMDEIEIIHNENAMIPLPGTFQGGHKVKVIR